LLALKSYMIHPNSVAKSSSWCAVIGGCVLALAPAARAYVLVGPGWSQPDGPGSPITLTYSYRNMFDDGLLMPDGAPLPKLLIRDSIEEALGLWASVAPLHFVEVDDDGRLYGSGGATKYGTIRFQHIHINGPDPPPPAAPIAKAQAYYPGGSRSSGDVEYDHSDHWQEIGTLPQPDILGATVHELGHSLGLGHSASDAANMYWIFNRFSGLGTAFLDQDDINGIHARYGAGVGSVTPLAGSWPDRAIEPAAAHRRDYEFTNVPTGRWVESPLGPKVFFTAGDGALFSGLAELPTGLEDPVAISADGNLLGHFEAGQSVSFQAFPGGGVSEFEISGLGSPANLQSSLSFPLKLAFTTSTGSFTASAVPEPAAHMLLCLTLIALSKSRRPLR
jgi:hypothetical protein